MSISSSMRSRERLQQAVSLHQGGAWAEAEAAYRALLAQEPQHPDANHNLGVLHAQQGRHREALPFLQAALNAQPAQAQFWLSYCETLLKAGDAQAAQQVAEQAQGRGLSGPQWDWLVSQINTALSPQRALEALLKLDQPGQVAALETAARDFVRQHGRVPRALHCLGKALLQQKRDAEALPWLQEAAASLADDVNVLNQYALVLNHLHRFDEAHAVFLRALELKPNVPELMANLADNLNDAGRYDEAEPWLRRGLALAPTSFALRTNLGIALLGLGRDEEALPLITAMLDEGQRSPELLQAQAVLLRGKGAYAAAEAALREALELDPTREPALHALANVLNDLGRVDEALAINRALLERKPDFDEAQTNLLFGLNYRQSATAEERLLEARKFGAMVQRKLAAQDHQPFSEWQCEASPACLRVGLVSGDLRVHPVGFFLESVLDKLAQRRFELYAYQTNPKADDELSARLQPCFAKWTRVAGWTDERLARQIVQDGIHVLVDLAGHTAYNRLSVFAWKPAPVQASWLGYFATTGVAEMDWVLADRVSVPDSVATQFTEKVFHLPDSRLCFTPPSSAVPVSPLPAKTKGHFTFGSFQTLSKVGDEVLATWARILRRLPAAVLRLQAKQLGDAQARRELMGRLQTAGIDPARVMLHGHAQREAYLAAHAEVDLILDTFPYPGGTTTCEALWMGVPTLTLAGNTMLARQGASLLMAAGLKDWVANSVEDYVTKAVRLASDVQRLEALRAQLRQQVSRSALFDSQRFAKHLENALWKLWQHYARRANKAAVRPASKESKTRLHTQTGQKTAGKSPARLPAAPARSQQQPDQATIDTIVRHFKADEFQAAIPLARDLTLRFPDYAFGWKALGAVLKGAGQIEGSIDATRRATELKPDDMEALANLGNALREAGRREEAIEVLRASLLQDGQYAESHLNLGVCLQEKGLYEEALQHYHRALDLKPDIAGVWANIGGSLKELGRYEEALEALKTAIAKNPKDTTALNNLGATYRTLGQVKKAVETYQQAIRIRPDYAQAYNNLGEALKQAGHHGYAVQSYQKALEINPDYAEAASNLGGTLLSLGRREEAESWYLRAMALKPSLLDAHGNLLTCWTFDDRVPMPERVEQARSYGRKVTAMAHAPYTAWPLLGQEPEGPLRIGFVSGDLRNHPVGYFLESVLANLDKRKVLTIAYSTNPVEDEGTERLKQLFDEWRMLPAGNDRFAAETVYQDRVHILVDLAGHTNLNRLTVFGWRPAPVQVTWLGYFATTGVEQIDWVIADETGVPARHHSHFTEKVWYLPNTRLCFTPPVGAPPVAALPALRNGYVTFGCFQNLPKVGDDVMALWAQIMKALPDSRLRLQCKQFSEAATQQHVATRLQAAGIDPARVSMVGPCTRADYLAAHAEVDFILDTFPYTGGTTTCEALWMGVPTLTLAGESMLSRQGASLLTAAGLTEWVVESPDDYVMQARRFAADLPALASLRSGLRAAVQESPLFDGTGFARHLECAFAEMWEKFLESNH